MIIFVRNGYVLHEFKFEELNKEHTKKIIKDLYSQEILKSEIKFKEGSKVGGVYYLKNIEAEDVESMTITLK